jgi:hypothetical protein
LLCLLLISSVAACENSTDPFIGFGGTPGLAQAQADGNWSFTLTRTSSLGCTGGSLASGQVLTATLDVLSDGSLAAATSSWQNPPTTTVRPLSGSINLNTGVTDILLAAASGSSAAMELQGTMTSTGSFSGTLSDPAPGFFQVFGACSYTAAGNKTG